jgi:hypothetical protein
MSGRPIDLLGVNAAAAAWCAAVNAPVHTEMCAIPDERLITEREVLGAVAVTATRDRPVLTAY